MSEPVTFHLKKRELKAEPFHYTACGLDYVYLLNGFHIEDDPDYGKILTIEREDDLHRAIGLHIVESGEMSGSEFRFLRKLMGLTQGALGERMGLEAQTIANYEKGKSIPGPSGELMRIHFLLHTFPEDVRASLLRDLMAPPAEKKPVRDAAIHRREKKRIPSQARNRIARSWREDTKAAA
jgi:transcriptional regulator with XRE-family HTH domain